MAEPRVYDIFATLMSISFLPTIPRYISAEGFAMG
jgi:hypothetical protein